MYIIEEKSLWEDNKKACLYHGNDTKRYAIQSTSMDIEENSALDLLKLNDWADIKIMLILSRSFHNLNSHLSHQRKILENIQVF